MEQLAPLLKEYGVWVAALAVIAYFLIKHWWPYWKEQDTAERLEKREQMNRMLSMQEGAIKEMTTAIHASTRQSETIADRMEALTEEIRARR